MPRLSEFIEVQPNQSQSTEVRRTIRSHAARASGLADPSSSRRRVRTARSTNISFVTSVATEVPGPQVANQDEGKELAPTSLTGILTRHELGPVLFVGNDSAIPASNSMLQGLPFLPLVVNNYLTNLTFAAPELDGLSESFLLRRTWFPMVLHSTTLFQVVALFSASHYASLYATASSASDILFMKQCALRGLQSSMASGGGVSYRDEIIAAVCKMAAYEAIYGTERAYHIHMEAVARMIEQRGGLSSLGLNGFLARLLVFVDTNSAFLLSTSVHLSDSSFPRREPLILPRPDRFIGIPLQPPNREDGADPSLRIS